VIAEAFPRDVLTAFAAMTDLNVTPGSNGTAEVERPSSNGTVRVERRQRARDVGRRVSTLADDLAAMLATEPFGLSCDALALSVHRRRADVLAALRADPRFIHDGDRKGSRWRLREGSRDGQGRTTSPLHGRAIGQLVVARMEAAEREAAALRTRLADREAPAA
jgi:hypothetical protein